jgi:hypothetical protein
MLQKIDQAALADGVTRSEWVSSAVNAKLKGGVGSAEKVVEALNGKSPLEDFLNGKVITPEGQKLSGLFAAKPATDSNPFTNPDAATVKRTSPTIIHLKAGQEVSF